KIFGRNKKEPEAYHALSQLTLAINNRKISKKAIIIHLFGKNPMISDAILSLIPYKFRKFFENLLESFFKRLFIGMCFLHSENSSDIIIKQNEKNYEFIGKKKFNSFVIYLKLLFNLLKNIKNTGLLPIPFLGGVSLPGSSVHFGASLSVNSEGILRTNINGELIAAPLVYIADSSSLPDIPAGSYTLSIMANAYRIGNIVAKYESER
ncbi:MAG: hypothetical protein WCJ33_05465, partial [Pseudomonadota bacterium]